MLISASQVEQLLETYKSYKHTTNHINIQTITSIVQVPLHKFTSQYTAAPKTTHSTKRALLLMIAKVTKKIVAFQRKRLYGM